jgi:hypothetical protein
MVSPINQNVIDTQNIVKTITAYVLAFGRDVIPLGKSFIPKAGPAIGYIAIANAMEQLGNRIFKNYPSVNKVLNKAAPFLSGVLAISFGFFTPHQAIGAFLIDQVGRSVFEKLENKFELSKKFAQLKNKFEGMSILS